MDLGNGGDGFFLVKCGYDEVIHFGGSRCIRWRLEDLFVDGCRNLSGVGGGTRRNFRSGDEHGWLFSGGGVEEEPAVVAACV